MPDGAGSVTITFEFVGKTPRLYVHEEQALVIYGVALLAVCMLFGTVVGELLGRLLGVDANVGGVGIAMLALIGLSEAMKRRGCLNPVSQQGILFWSAIYIPIVVAMAASQNVLAAVKGGPAALLAGGLATAACFALVPVLAGLGGRRAESSPAPAGERVDE